MADEKKDVDVEEVDTTKEDVENTDDAEVTENDNESASSENEDKEEDNRTFGEKVDDAMDEVAGTVQDFFYGPKDEDNVIAQMNDPDTEFRHINKIQTRRNIIHKLFGKKGVIIFLIVMGVMFLIGFLVSKFG